MTTDKGTAAFLRQTSSLLNRLGAGRGQWASLALAAQDSKQLHLTSAAKRCTWQTGLVDPTIAFGSPAAGGHRQLAVELRLAKIQPQVTNNSSQRRSALVK